MRLRYSGTGAGYLRPSLRGYHALNAREREWVLGPGVFWAAEGNVRLGVRLAPMLASFYVGDGLTKFQTVVSGDGQVAINAPGPVEEVEIGDGELVVHARVVLGRTTVVRYRTRQVARLVQSIIAGEPRARSYRGPGKALVCWTPYWNEYMHSRFSGGEASPSWWS